jgi:hypothetical protein
MTTGKPDQEDYEAVAARYGVPNTEAERAYHYRLAQLNWLHRLGFKDDDNAREERLRDLGERTGYRLLKARGSYLLLDLAVNDIAEDALSLDGVEEWLTEAWREGERALCGCYSEAPPGRLKPANA